MNLTKEQREQLSRTWVGIDAGIGSELTFNVGNLKQAFNLDSRNNPYLLNRLAKIKLAQKDLSLFCVKFKVNKNTKKSKQYQKLKDKINKLWTQYENIKSNMVNHIISFLKQFKEVYFQDEMIKSWHQNKLKGYGKKIQAGILGKVYAKLKELAKSKPEQFFCLPSKAKTTQHCPQCNTDNKIALSTRIYNCSCGYINNRDCHSAFNMIVMHKNQVFGRNTFNSVQNLTDSNSTVTTFAIVLDKLSSKTGLISTLDFQTSTTGSLVL